VPLNAVPDSTAPSAGLPGHPGNGNVDACDLHPHDLAALTALKTHLLQEGTVLAVADVFKLLGDPTRVRVVDALSHGERCVCDLASLIGISESALSHQLRLLRAARLVRVRRAGRLAYYSVDDHHVLGLLRDTRKHVEEAS
jgi:ArsR family transcriptional regulator, lead/cadmium/zinc/bismuth-responsive transcriptional repressor